MPKVSIESGRHEMRQLPCFHRQSLNLMFGNKAQSDRVKGLFELELDDDGKIASVNIAI